MSKQIDPVADAIATAEGKTLKAHDEAVRRHSEAMEEHAALVADLAATENEIETMHAAFRSLSDEFSDLDYAVASAKAKRLGINVDAAEVNVTQALRQVVNVDKAAAITFGVALDRHLNGITPVHPTFERPPYILPDTPNTHAYVILSQTGKTDYKANGRMSAELFLYCKRERGYHADLSEAIIESIMLANEIQGNVYRVEDKKDYQTFRVSVLSMVPAIPFLPQIESLSLKSLPSKIAGKVMDEVVDGAIDRSRSVSGNGFTHRRGATGYSGYVEVANEVNPTTGERTLIVDIPVSTRSTSLSTFLADQWTHALTRPVSGFQGLSTSELAGLLTPRL